MRAIILVPLCVISAVVLHAQAGSSSSDESAVREVVKKYVEARERADADAIGALFTEDADQLVSSGEWRRGRSELVKGTLASSKANSGTRTIAIKTVRFPTTAVAIADGEYTIAGTGGTPDRNMWTSFVMVRASGSWRITAIRNMLPTK